MRNTTVLVVDADEQARTATVETLRTGLESVTIHTAESLTAARETLDRERVDAVVTAYELGDGNGLELADGLHSTDPATGCILYTDQTALDTEAVPDAIVEFVHRGMPDAERRLVALVEEASIQQSHAPYPLVDSEADRLDAIEDYIRDTDATAGPLERLTRLAAAYFEVEVVSVNIIKQRTQEFLATSGPAWPPEKRSDSLSTHTIVNEESVMAVEDVGEDPRFVDNESLESTDIVAYLGAKIETPEGHALGSLCVYDDEPRTFSAADKAYLELLADLVVDVLMLDHGNTPEPPGETREGRR